MRRTFQTEQAISDLSVYDNVAMISLPAARRGAASDVLAAIDFVGLGAPPEARWGRSASDSAAWSKSRAPWRAGPG